MWYNGFDKKFIKTKEVQAMGYCSTVVGQLLRVFPRHEFEQVRRAVQPKKHRRALSAWTQFVAMLVGQLAGRDSLRGIVDAFSPQSRKLYHLGLGSFSRSSLARANEKTPAELFEKVFVALLARCQSLAPPNQKFRFKDGGKVYLLDATVIELPLSLFCWATYRASKGAMKLHVGLAADGYLPSFVDMTAGRVHEINKARELRLPRGSWVVFDRGYTDYQWYQDLTKDGVHFVTRLKRGAAVQPGAKRRGCKSAGILEDREIRFRGVEGVFRTVRFLDEARGEEYEFVTNAVDIPATTVAALYKERWQVELFFKWIKQHLKVKSFVGGSMNAVRTQLWIALCAYLLVAFIKFRSRLGQSILLILRLVQLNLFERRDLDELFCPEKQKIPLHNNQLSLFQI